MAFLRGLLAATVLATIFGVVFELEANINANSHMDGYLILVIGGYAFSAFMIGFLSHPSTRPLTDALEPILTPFCDLVGLYLARAIVGIGAGIAEWVVVSICNIVICLVIEQRWPQSVLLRQNEVLITGPVVAVYCGSILGAIFGVCPGHDWRVLRTAAIAGFVALIASVWLVSIGLSAAMLLEVRQNVRVTPAEANVFMVASGLVAGVWGVIWVRIRKL